MAEEPLDIGHGEPEIDGQKYTPDVPGGGVETIENSPPTARKAFFTGLAFELLDAIAAAIADEGMEGGISVAPIDAQWVRAGVPGGANALMFSASAFPQSPRLHARFVGMPPKRFGMRSATNGAVERRARLEGARVFRQTERVMADLTPTLK
jgi:hypothetical protein